MEGEKYGSQVALRNTMRRLTNKILVLIRQQEKLDPNSLNVKFMRNRGSKMEPWRAVDTHNGFVEA